ncbi:uncharacterized protein LOC128636775 [Bombina bombina]|uniref:uncharacterized protein LOC128636775 n=1 Tax=Bombina bombina TaxID=8345 RepID=UPI00235A5DFD|nr:uncharacterized protein LOC128636775 [Bombina bombina]
MSSPGVSGSDPERRSVAGLATKSGGRGKVAHSLAGPDLGGVGPSVRCCDGQGGALVPGSGVAVSSGSKGEEGQATAALVVGGPKVRQSELGLGSLQLRPMGPSQFSGGDEYGSGEECEEFELGPGEVDLFLNSSDEECVPPSPGSSSKNVSRFGGSAERVSVGPRPESVSHAVGGGGTARFREEVGVCGSHVSFSLPEHSPSERRPGPQPGPSLREDVFDGLEEDFSGLQGSWTDSIRLEHDDGPQQEVRPVGRKEDQPRQLAQQGRPAATSTGGERETTGQRSSGLQATFSSPSSVRNTESTSAGETGLLNVGGSDVTLCVVRSVDCDSVTGSVVAGLKVLLAKLEGVGPAQGVGVERAWVPVDRPAGVPVVERVEDCSVAVPDVSGGGVSVVAQTSGPIVGSSGVVSRQGEGAELRVADTAMSRSCLCSIGPLGMYLTSEVRDKIYKRDFIELFSLLPLEQSFEIPETWPRRRRRREKRDIGSCRKHFLTGFRHF